MRVLSIAACVACAWPVCAQSLPSGFVDEPLATGFAFPAALACLPDGRILVVERLAAAVSVVAGPQRAILGTIPDVRTSGGEGVLGLAVDPGWPARPFLYVVYNHALSPFLHIARFDVTGDLSNGGSANLALGGRHLILTDIPDNDGSHNGGTLRFGPDGMLYASLGDDENACSAQDPTILGGGILRLDVSAVPAGPGGPPPKSLLAPAGNPFPGPNENARLRWALGLRQPFRMQIDPVSGAVAAGDVGSFLFEEIDVATAGGANFGWPFLEGPAASATCPGPAPAGLTPPAAALDRSLQPGPATFVALAAYRNPAGAPYALGGAYEGNIFYLDFYFGFVRRLAWSGSQWAPAPAAPGQPNPTDWATGYGGVADGAVHPDGSICYLRHNTGELRRIRPGVPSLQVAIVSGAGQVGTSGQPLPAPIVVRVTDSLAIPAAGLPVTFADTTGGATFGPQPVLTDPAGLAAATPTLGPGPATIQVSAAGGPFLAVPVVWRGLGAASGIQLGQTFVMVALAHSQTNAPFTLVVEPPGLATPVPTAAGTIWTTILAPSVATVVFDGLGIVGPPDPAYRTGPVAPTWELTVWNPPAFLAGVVLICQAYAVDSTLPLPAGVLVTNPAYLTFP